MPSFDPTRLDAGNYSYSVSVETRFQDLDPLGHINNVAMAALFETGRVRFNREILISRQQRNDGDRWLVARVEINYLAEGHFPEPVQIASGIGRIGNRSWQIVSAAWQQGQCIALCDSTLVYQSAGGKASISDELRGELEALRFKG